MHTECRGRSQLPIHESRALNSSSSSSSSIDGAVDAETVWTVAGKFDFIINERTEKRSRRGGNFSAPKTERKTFIVFHSMTTEQTRERIHHASLHDRCPICLLRLHRRNTSKLMETLLNGRKHKAEAQGQRWAHSHGM